MERQIEQMILQGESATLEFKKELGEPFAIIQTVVAFANTEGGSILIGVNDDGNVVGIDEIRKAKKKISEWVESRCDPPVEITFDTISIKEKKILRVLVPKGNNPPYLHRDNGAAYIR